MQHVQCLSDALSTFVRTKCSSFEAGLSKSSLDADSIASMGESFRVSATSWSICCVLLGTTAMALHSLIKLAQTLGARRGERQSIE